MAMSSLSPATSSVRSICQQPRITAKLRTPPKSLLSLQGNLLSWSSSANYVKLRARNTIVVKGLPQKRNATIKCATMEEIEAEKFLIEKNARERMEKAIDSVLSNFNSIRTGRSNPAMLDKVEELSKIVSKQAEEGKVAIRNIRRDAIKSYDKLEKEKKLSEDNVKDLSVDLQKVTDEYMKKIDTIFKQKEKELLTV
ncbi:Ribosome recycling factor [Cynara cardunculus var. scolymus]|uniref:Ribosome-recycling factor, chloroplastic n=1 Tax=Cynara cardunculus var. scolymus TaxID=59895 RepID=A0A118JVW1_CYNCS|nr:Ribosome recycling factor [Cynara cardunculus var. scolymus]